VPKQKYQSAKAIIIVNIVSQIFSFGDNNFVNWLPDSQVKNCFPWVSHLTSVKLSLQNVIKK
jgi:hypothetical protein